MAVIRGVAQSGRVLALGARCRRFESFRPDQKIQTVAFAAVLIFCLERADSNDKRSFVGGRIFHSIYHKYVINLRVSSYLCELRWACSYILGFAPIKICCLRRKRGIFYSKMHGM